MSFHPQSQFACTACKSRKRKCDKRIPTCSLCERKDLACSYEPQSARRKRHNPDLLQLQGVFRKESPVLRLSPATTDESRSTTSEPGVNVPFVEFPSVIFLDLKISQQYQVQIPKINIPIPASVVSIISDITRQHGIAKVYFENAHPWVPIVAKKRFYEQVNPFSPLRADYALLILCMDLICWLPGSAVQEPRTATYVAAKRYYLDLEIAGIISIQILQAGVLIAMFELGHAIYPSAFLSVAACARYGSTLGLDQKDSSLEKQENLSWMEVEERNRVRWAILLLDRIINIGRPEQLLLLPDPALDMHLPIKDSEWDLGIAPTKPAYTVATTCLSWGDMGPFALVAQATRLLGQVLRHISSAVLDEEEATLLDRALGGLAKIVVVEEQLQDLHMMNQQAICSVALLLLHEAHSSGTGKTEISRYLETNHYVATCNAELERSIDVLPKHTKQIPVETCVEEASPFLTVLLYQIGVANERLHRERGTDETKGSLDMIRTMLGTFDTRWKAAGAYLKIVEAREMLCRS